MPQSIPEFSSVAIYGLNDLILWAVSRRLSHGIERSARFYQKSFESRRELASFAIGDVGENAVAEVLEICRKMRTPVRHLQSIARFISAAAYIHFGFEFSGDTIVRKCYLELPAPVETADSGTSRLQFLGFKWSVNNDSIAVVTRYRLLSPSSWQEAVAIMLSNCGKTLRPSMEMLLNAVSSNGQNEPIAPRLLEIEEEGSDRRSYDLNLYDCGVMLAVLRDPLRNMAAVFDVDVDATDLWLTENSGTLVGHVAAGLGRDQNAFLTVYYGLRPVMSMKGISS